MKLVTELMAGLGNYYLVLVNLQKAIVRYM